MNTNLKHEIDAESKPNSKKYGWTLNVQARHIFEKMHDFEYLSKFVEDNPQTLPYVLKRLVVTNRIKAFKTIIEELGSNATPNLLKWLMVVAVRFSRSSIIDFLKDRADHDYLELTRYFIKRFAKSEAAFKKSETIVFERALTEDMKRLSFSLRCNLYSIATAYKDDFMLYVVNKSFGRSLLDPPLENEITSLREGMKIFGYDYVG